MHRVSKTYKLVIPGENEHKIYFTIVGDNCRHPEAFFVNSKSMRHFQWVTALMTSYSRQIEAGIPVEGIIEDMKQTFDPNGKYIIQDGTGREAVSIIHHLGLILEQHVSCTNLY